MAQELAPAKPCRVAALIALSILPSCAEIESADATCASLTPQVSGQATGIDEPTSRIVTGPDVKRDARISVLFALIAAAFLLLGMLYYIAFRAVLPAPLEALHLRSFAPAAE